jgi:excinuclease ABC subunit B
VPTIERTEILRDLRNGEFDVLVGINLLREGLNLPEVSLVAILDADKEGFLRSERSLIQTMGRAARNVRGTVILYADQETDSIRSAVAETNRRRETQAEYNRANGITPRTVESAITALGESLYEADYVTVSKVAEEDYDPNALRAQVSALREQMRTAAEDLDFERAAEIRDKIKALEEGALIAGYEVEGQPARGAGSTVRRPSRGGRRRR